MRQEQTDNEVTHMIYVDATEYNYAELEEQYLMARAAACRAMPYLQQLIIAMGHTMSKDVLAQYEVSPGKFAHVPTMCVSTAGHCLMHPAFVLKVLDECGGVPALGYIIAHEAMHLLFKHPTRKLRLIEKEGDSFDMEASGLAADYTINPSLTAISQKRKPGVIWISDPTGSLKGVNPAQNSMEEGLSYEQYYHLLKNNKKKQNKSTGQPGQGCSPSAENDQDNSDKTQKLMREVSGISEARLNNIAEQALQDARKAEERSPGSVPAGILCELEASFQEPKVRWQDVLKAAVLHAVQHREGADDAIWTKPARKQAGIGHGIGNARLPGYVEYKPTITVIADTSGSMRGDLDHIRDETMGIIHEIGCDVDFISCDTDAHDAGRIGTATQVVQSLKGGGGTDMNPALDIAKQKNSDVVVCITDGHIGDYGENRGYRLIFCVVPSGTTQGLQKCVNEGWGAIVQIGQD